jgi:hypothetical protein
VRRAPVDFRGLELADPLEALERSEGEAALVDLPVASCRGLELMGFACRRGACHPFVETAAGIAEGTVSGYRDSPLRRYYEGYRPVTLGDVFGPLAAGPARDVDVLDAAAPWDNTPGPHMRAVRRHACQREKREFEAEGISDEDESWRDWGPVSEAKAALEFCRIESVTHSLMQHGFVPKADLGEQIWVRLLTSGRRSVAWVYSGHHRTAALAALGYETVPVYVMRQVFRRDEVSSWPGVAASGAFTPEAALTIFDMAFKGRSDPWPGCVLSGTGSAQIVPDRAAPARSGPVQNGDGRRAGVCMAGSRRPGAGSPRRLPNAIFSPDQTG